jgi:hypothetical protein
VLGDGENGSRTGSDTAACGRSRAQAARAWGRAIVRTLGITGPENSLSTVGTVCILSSVHRNLLRRRRHSCESRPHHADNAAVLPRSFQVIGHEGA